MIEDVDRSGVAEEEPLNCETKHENDGYTNSNACYDGEQLFHERR